MVVLDNVLRSPAVQKAAQKVAKEVPVVAARAWRVAKVGQALWADASAAEMEARAALSQLGGVSGALTAWAVGDVSARITAQNLKQRVLGAWRVARVDTELLEAFQIFEVHEHRATAYRAQAVVFLKILERDAESTLSRLPEYRRQQLAEVARQIKEASLKMAELTRTDTNCGKCVRKLAPDLRGGDCCSGMVFLGWDEVDAAFRVLLGERAPVVREFHGDMTRCGFLSETGCQLTPGTRPTVCQAYYCDSYRQDLKDQGRWEELSKLLLELNGGRRGMGFRLNLARRFVLQEDVKGTATHPMDFVWDRLRQSGAEVSAAGKRQDAQSRLRVVP